MIRIRHNRSRLVAFQVAPVISTRPVTSELLAQMYRIVTVDEHERLAGSQCVEAGENHRVPLRFGYASHVQLASGISSRIGIVESTHVLILFLQVVIGVICGV